MKIQCISEFRKRNPEILICSYRFQEKMMCECVIVEIPKEYPLFSAAKRQKIRKNVENIKLKSINISYIPIQCTQ